MFKIEFAGTGGAVPLKDRNLSSVLFSYAGRKIIFDVGEGTQQNLLKLHSGFVNIDIICLSHLHGDHIFGLPGLLCTMGMAKRTNDLLILAPKGSRQLLSQFVCLVGRQDYGVYVLELGSNDDNMPSEQAATFQAKIKQSVAFQLTKKGYKIDLSLSDANVVNSDNFYCLLAKKEKNADNLISTSIAVNSNTECAEITQNENPLSLKEIHPRCNLFYTDDTPEQLKNNSRLVKKLHKYENLQFTYTPNTPANLYISSALQKHSVTCIAFRLDFYKAGRFHVDKAKAKGILQAFWSFLQNGYNVSYTLNERAYKFTPASVTSPPVKLFSLAYVTDSRPVASNANFLKDTQVLISEANYLSEDKKELAIKNKHMTLEEACNQAKKAQVKQLILTHFSASITDPDLYKDYAKELFFNSYFAHDLDSFTFIAKKDDSEPCQTAILTDRSNVLDKGEAEYAEN